MLVLTQTGSPMVWRGVGSRSITSTGGLSHQFVPGLCLQSKRGNEILLAMRLHTPVEISTKKSFLQILAPPKTVPSALQARRVTQWSDINIATSPDRGKRLKYTALRARYFSPSCHLLAPVLSKAAHSVHPPRQMPRAERPCSPRLLPRHPSPGRFPSTSSMQQSVPTHHVLLQTR